MDAHRRLSADALIGLIRGEFEQVPDSRADNAKIALPDALMSGFAMFSLKDPSPHWLTDLMFDGFAPLQMGDDKPFTASSWGQKRTNDRSGSQ